ncbi:MAG: hypothetical protein A2007_03835 [Verrucomicrobia bacterium GWC2_42_7]|nr:MAG: hypothetical protein A2007_03835 [Verrucomicrobia bacterium GWC2_42_7]
MKKLIILSLFIPSLLSASFLEWLSGKTKLEDVGLSANQLHNLQYHLGKKLESWMPLFTAILTENQVPSEELEAVLLDHSDADRIPFLTYLKNRTATYPFEFGYEPGEARAKFLERLVQTVHECKTQGKDFPYPQVDDPCYPALHFRGGLGDALIREILLDLAPWADDQMLEASYYALRAFLTERAPEIAKQISIHSTEVPSHEKSSCIRCCLLCCLPCCRCCGETTTKIIYALPNIIGPVLKTVVPIILPVL